MQTIINIPDKLWKVLEEIAKENHMCPDDYLEVTVEGWLDNIETGREIDQEWETHLREEPDVIFRLDPEAC